MNFEPKKHKIQHQVTRSFNCLFIQQRKKINTKSITILNLELCIYLVKYVQEWIEKITSPFAGECSMMVLQVAWDAPLDQLEGIPWKRQHNKPCSFQIERNILLKIIWPEFEFKLNCTKVWPRIWVNPGTDKIRPNGTYCIQLRFKWAQFHWIFKFYQVMVWWGLFGLDLTSNGA